MYNKKGLFIPFICFLVLFTNSFCKNSSATQPESPDSDIPRDKVVLIVNGDDVGVTQVFTDATIDAYLKGKISSASIIAPGDDAGRAVKLLKEHPELDIGIHLTLTGEWKPLTAGLTLRNPSGLMWNTSGEAARNVNPEEASVEWEAQIKRILDAGISISHIDSHMGCYFLSRDLFIAAYTLAKKYRIPMISAFIPGQVPPEEKRFFLLSSYTGIYDLGNQEENLENRTLAYWNMFGAFKPGIHYIYSHHGWEPPGKQVSGDPGLRINDYKFWTCDETHKRLDQMGYVMIGCKLLKSEFNKALEEN